MKTFYKTNFNNKVYPSQLYSPPNLSVSSPDILSKKYDSTYRHIYRKIGNDIEILASYEIPRQRQIRFQILRLVSSIYLDYMIRLNDVFYIDTDVDGNIENANDPELYNEIKDREKKGIVQLYIRFDINNTKLCRFNVGLRQLKGTCWFNASLNALTMSTFGDAFVRMAVDMYVCSLSQEEMTEFKKIDPTDTCTYVTDTTQNNKMLLYKTLYNMLLIGGFLNLESNQMDNFIKSFGLRLKPHGSKTFGLKEVYKSLNMNATYMSYDEFTNISNTNDYINDVIVIENLFMNRYGVKVKTQLPKTIHINGEKYSLNYALIDLYYHVVNAFIGTPSCKKETYVYDSNDMLIVFDWTKPASLNTLLDIINQRYVVLFGISPKYPKILLNHVVYVKDKYIKFIEEINKIPFINTGLTTTLQPQTVVLYIPDVGCNRLILKNKKNIILINKCPSSVFKAVRDILENVCFRTLDNEFIHNIVDESKYYMAKGFNVVIIGRRYGGLIASTIAKTITTKNELLKIITIGSAYIPPETETLNVDIQHYKIINDNLQMCFIRKPYSFTTQKNVTIIDDSESYDSLLQDLINSISTQ